MSSADERGLIQTAAVGGTVFTRIRGELESGNLDRLEEQVPELMHIAVLSYLGPEVAEEELRMPRLGPPASL